MKRKTTGDKMSYDTNERKTANFHDDKTRGVFECPNCGKKQHAIFSDIRFRTMLLKCIYCGCKWKHETLSIEERKQRNRDCAKRFYYENTELVKERVKKWYEENKDYRKQYMHEYYLKKKREAGKDKEVPFQCVRKPVAVCDKITMEIIETYPSAREAELFAGVGEVTIKSQCRYKRVPKGEVVYRYADEVDVNESFEGGRYRPIKVTDITNGDVKFFYYLDDIASEYYISKSSISTRLKNGDLLYSKYKIEYAR